MTPDTDAPTTPDPAVTTTPAARLLLRALRAGICEEKCVASEQLHGSLSGDLVDLALDKRVAFQLLASLRSGRSFAHVPSESLKKLWSQVREAAARTSLQRFHAAQLLNSCAQRGIPVILTKGLWLADHVYRDVGARDACDIDLLLRPEHVPAFTDAARELGFEVPAATSHLASHASTTNELSLWHADRTVMVDVHWSLTHPVTEAPVDEKSLWFRSEFVELAGTRCRTLRLEDHLLYLCFHAAGHHKFWGLGPRCLLDVAMVLRHPPRPIDWDVLVANARELGWQKPAWLTFALVQEHFGVMAPSDVMRALHAHTPADVEICRLAIKAIFAAQAPDGLHRHLAHLLTLPSWRRRAAALGRMLWPSRVQMTNQFGLCEEIPTWRLRMRRWKILGDGLSGSACGLLFGGAPHRAEMANVRRYQEWLAGADSGLRRLKPAFICAAIPALFAVPVIAMLLRCMSLAGLLARIENGRRDLRLDVDHAAALGRAVNIVTTRKPWPARCLTRSLALHWLLRRRGIASVLRLGVARADGFRAHAWVECGGVPVNDRLDVADIFSPFESLSFERGRVGP